jgi:hypothetical protein
LFGGKIYFQNDNAKPHFSKIVTEKIPEFGLELLPHPSYSLGLASSYYHLINTFYNYLNFSLLFYQPNITEEKLNLIKFFITSNLSLAQLKNVYLRLILKDEVKLPSFFTFRYKYLNEVLSLLHDKIEKKCQDASYITLIPDGWTDSSGSEYLGIFYLT